ncbi:unnamed protein product [Didymodactylos carnosus]|uniref:Uncharacterized protein n=1 Tax=Didymodactylos carnosus TaxID=1234261 RepID=A0A816CB38_9BILA|nr:unnamed protein product [Didymodactylos carnosus]CAF4513458.1 unnamed protein product [Didymodactylos carnosus]
MWNGTLNGGVTLYDCQGYRRHRIWEQMLVYNYLEWDKRFRVKELWPQSADQNLVNLLISNNLSITPIKLRDYVFVLPCSCNYMYPPVIDDNFRRSICPVEMRVGSSPFGTLRMINDIIYERLKKVLTSRGKYNLITVTKAEARSATAYLKQMGWEQALTQTSNAHFQRTLALGPTVYFGHSVSGYKNNDQVFNQLRRLYLIFDEKYLNKINPWNYNNEDWLY